jgi:hypothetical protein
VKVNKKRLFTPLFKVWANLQKLAGKPQGKLKKFYLEML